MLQLQSYCLRRCSPEFLYHLLLLLQIQQNCPNVPTTFSFATRPVIAATAIFQLPHPSGVKIHAIRLPILANDTLSLSSFHCCILPVRRSSAFQMLRLSIRSSARTRQRWLIDVIIVPAFLMKDQPRSHILLNTFPDCRHSDMPASSITNGAGSPANILVFFRMIPEQMIAAIPTKYALGATHEAPSKICTCDQGDDRKFRSTWDKCCCHDCHLTVTVILDGTGSHNSRNTTSGTDQHRDE